MMMSGTSTSPKSAIVIDTIILNVVISVVGTIRRPTNPVRAGIRMYVVIGGSMRSMRLLNPSDVGRSDTLLNVQQLASTQSVVWPVPTKNPSTIPGAK